MKITDSRTEFYQWDRHQRLLAEDIPTQTELHLALVPTQIYAAVGNDNLTTLSVITYTENGTVYADIPDQLLQMAGTLQVFVYPRNDPEAHTAASFEFKVLPRPRPADYIFTEAEKREWDALYAQLLHPIAATSAMTVAVGVDPDKKLWTFPQTVDRQLSIYSHNAVSNSAVAGFAAGVEDTFEEIGGILEEYGATMASLQEQLQRKANAPLPGDINRDGNVTAADRELLRRYLAGEDISIEEENADVNGDGVLNMQDVARIEQYLSGIAVEMLPSPMATKAYVKSCLNEYIADALGGEY